MFPGLGKVRFNIFILEQAGVMSLLAEHLFITHDGSIFHNRFTIIQFHH